MTPSQEQGLTAAQAAERLTQWGPNAVVEPHVSILGRVARRFWEPVPWMLEAAIVLQWAIGERLEAFTIALLLIFNVALGVFQEGRANGALTALKAKLALSAFVKRDGHWCEVAASDLVPGDIVRLALGGVVPADITLVDGSVLLDQSMLTGESIAVEAGVGKPAYAGALVRRGAATGEVTATGARTFFGRTAELVRIAHAESGEQAAVLGVVRNLAIFNGTVVLLIVAYARSIAMPIGHIVPLIVTALLGSVPVALPATFTLAAAFSAQALARKGVLLTRLSAIFEAATVDVLCSDKTGTLTRNSMSVASVRSMHPEVRESDVLAFAALASSDSGQDPVDRAIRTEALAGGGSILARKLVRFTPFDPAAKTSEALIADQGGQSETIIKGAPGAIAGIVASGPEVNAAVDSLTNQGFRVLAVARRSAGQTSLLGLIALSDPPRSDSAQLIRKMQAMGLHVVMVTGDAAPTAGHVATAIGLVGPVCPPGAIPECLHPEDFAVYAGVFPEDKYRLVKALQASGHVVGMCGDGANDAPALRQAQMGIAVSSATDVAKSAASMVLMEAGLGGIVTAIEEGRRAFQRILTYTLNALVKKFELVLFLGAGLVMTGHAILTPMLMALLLITGDFLTMSLTTDRATPSPVPDTWRMGPFTAAAAVLGLIGLTFIVTVVAVGKYVWAFDIAELRTLAFVTLVFASQATVYVVRERRHLWHSRPGVWLLVSSLFDVSTAGALAWTGTLMEPLAASKIAAVFVATVTFAVVLDGVRNLSFRVLKII